MSQGASSFPFPSSSSHTPSWPSTTLSSQGWAVMCLIAVIVQFHISFRQHIIQQLNQNTGICLESRPRSGREICSVSPRATLAGWRFGKISREYLLHLFQSFDDPAFGQHLAGHFSINIQNVLVWGLSSLSTPNSSGVSQFSANLKGKIFMRD